MVERVDGPAAKICGLRRNDDARHAERHGAEYLGLVLSAGFGRSVPQGTAASIVAGTRAIRVAVLVDEPLSRTVELADSIQAGVVQLHGSEDPTAVAAIRGSGDWKVWKAIRAAELSELERAVEIYGAVVDGLLVEGWKEGSVGGSGARVTLDPGAVRDIVPAELTFVLAGGLTEANVSLAVARFRPDVVDVSSGVERALGRKDPDRVAGFLKAARTAYVSIEADPASAHPPEDG